MKLVPHLTFDGNCKEAFEFYKDLFGGSLFMITFGESPAASHVPADWKDKIVHATLSLAETDIAGADVYGDEFKPAQGFYLLLEPKNKLEAEKLFSALSDGGDVKVSLQEEFWSIAYACLIDKFGTPWEISCKEAPSDAE
ncbi:MAG: VOC family protein [Pseudohongiellaceae bacterium]